MTTPDQLKQILADLDVLKGRGCPHTLKSRHRRVLARDDAEAVPVLLERSMDAAQSTITRIMGWAAERLGEPVAMIRYEHVWHWEIGVYVEDYPDDNFYMAGFTDTPFAAHAAILRAIAEAVGQEGDDATSR